jgi:hypothetical protein
LPDTGILRAFSDRRQRQLRSAAKAKLLVDMTQVHLHGAFGQMEFAGVHRALDCPYTLCLAPLSTRAQAARRSIRRNMLAGISLVTFLGAALGGWASTTDLAGALVAGGSVVVDSHIKKVQHQTGAPCAIYWSEKAHR